jgi:bifunctional non-homologous end joining protein LigD
VRHTRGITFYHRGKLPEIPPSVHQLHIRKREGGEGVRLWVDDLDGLIGLVAMDALNFIHGTPPSTTLSERIGS